MFESDILNVSSIPSDLISPHPDSPSKIHTPCNRISREGQVQDHHASSSKVPIAEQQAKDTTTHQQQTNKSLHAQVERIRHALKDDPCKSNREQKGGLRENEICSGLYSVEGGRDLDTTKGNERAGKHAVGTGDVILDKDASARSQKNHMKSVDNSSQRPVIRNIASAKPKTNDISMNSTGKDISIYVDSSRRDTSSIRRYSKRLQDIQMQRYPAKRHSAMNVNDDGSPLPRRRACETTEQQEHQQGISTRPLPAPPARMVADDRSHAKLRFSGSNGDISRPRQAPNTIEMEKLYSADRSNREVQKHQSPDRSYNREYIQPSDYRPTPKVERRVHRSTKTHPNQPNPPPITEVTSERRRPWTSAATSHHHRKLAKTLYRVAGVCTTTKFSSSSLPPQFLIFFFPYNFPSPPLLFVC